MAKQVFVGFLILCIFAILGYCDICVTSEYYAPVCSAKAFYPPERNMRPKGMSYNVKILQPQRDDKRPKHYVVCEGATFQTASDSTRHPLWVQLGTPTYHSNSTYDVVFKWAPDSRADQFNKNNEVGFVPAIRCYATITTVIEFFVSFYY